MYSCIVTISWKLRKSPVLQIQMHNWNENVLSAFVTVFEATIYYEWEKRAKISIVLSLSTWFIGKGEWMNAKNYFKTNTTKFIHWNLSDTHTHAHIRLHFMENGFSRSLTHTFQGFSISLQTTDEYWSSWRKLGKQLERKRAKIEQSASKSFAILPSMFGENKFSHCSASFGSLAIEQTYKWFRSRREWFHSTENKHHDILSNFHLKHQQQYAKIGEKQIRNSFASFLIVKKIVRKVHYSVQSLRVSGVCVQQHTILYCIKSVSLLRVWVIK